MRLARHPHAHCPFSATRRRHVLHRPRPTACRPRCADDLARPHRSRPSRYRCDDRLRHRQPAKGRPLAPQGQRAVPRRPDDPRRLLADEHRRSPPDGLDRRRPAHRRPSRSGTSTIAASIAPAAAIRAPSQMLRRPPTNSRRSRRNIISTPAAGSPSATARAATSRSGWRVATISPNRARSASRARCASTR